ncbi:MAG TPA: universal stress protein [Alphaproteobacteria bacterium]|nr:universal stress protein [Alphaproteobacteria bacterium]
MTAPASSQPALQDGAQASLPDTAPVSFKRFIVALDASDHANRALAEALRLSATAEGEITGIHAYAAALHDRRFRQMEGGLPERYLDEEEMSYQRDVHDDLITRGLDIISDSYHDQAQEACDAVGLPYDRLSPEGKNASRIVEALEAGRHDVLALGALGLGAVPGSLIGTVCERVVRRSPIDVLVIRDTGRAIGEGPVVVGLDGSPQSFGVLLTGFEMARRLGVELHAVAAYDPYYHYVAFNRIAGVLSDEAGKVFRFKEQEQLHEELIDEGIAKIYQSHLDVAARTATDNGIELTTKLLDGKPFKAIDAYVREVGASLLMLGKTGIHGDAMIDIGGNTENLLRLAPCHLWIGQASHVPALDIVAEESISWSHEAEELLNRAPEFARGMARQAVIRFAHAQGNTYITSDLVEQVASKMMPGRGEAAEAAASPETVWSDAAEAEIAKLEDPSQVAGIRLRAEKRARREGAKEVGAEHVRAFVEAPAEATLPWAAAALARLTRVPEAMRDRTRARIEDVARQQGAAEVTLQIVELGLEEARKAMHEAMVKGGHTKTKDD